MAVVEDFSRENLALIPDTSLSGARVARELDALIPRHGKLASCASVPLDQKAASALVASTTRIVELKPSSNLAFNLCL